jgi:predicted RNase H-like HicB family nuclease
MDAKATYEVEVRITPWEEGGYLAEAVGLQGCWAIADTVGQTIEDIREVVHLWLDARRTYDMPVPPELARADDVAIRIVLPVGAT